MGNSVLPAVLLGAIGVGLISREFLGAKRGGFGALDKLHLKTRRDSFIAYCGGVFVAISVWQAAAVMLGRSTTFLPTPVDTALAGYRLIRSGALPREASISLVRVAFGFVAASITGVTLGLLAGAFAFGKRLVLPANTFLRYVPPTAFASLLVVYFGIGESYKYAVIFLGVVFFVVQMTIDAVQDIDKRFVEIGYTSGLRPQKLFWEVLVRGSMPRVLDVLRINLSAAWTFLVVAELVAADSGLGHLIAVSQRFLRVDELFVGILTFGVIGMLSDYALGLLARRCFRWRYLRTD